MIDRMSWDEYQALKADQPGNKFSAQRTERDGIMFDSRHEARCYDRLKLLELGGEIFNLELQVPILLEGRNGPIYSRKGRQMRLTVDFRFVDWAGIHGAKGAIVHADAKGKPTRDYEVRRGVAAAQGIEVIEL